MGLGGISIWQLLIVLGIVVVIFGTGKLRSIGGDLGGAIKSFRKAMSDGASADDDTGGKPEEKGPPPKLEADPEPEAGTVAEGERKTTTSSSS